MATTKKTVKVGDMKPKKDAKGGAARSRTLNRSAKRNLDGATRSNDRSASRSNQ